MASRKDPSSTHHQWEHPSEPLLTFTESFNFMSFVNDHLPMSDAKRARLIGQERDGSILFAWEHTNNAGDMSTNVGLYHKNTPSFATIYQHETSVNIIAGTVNEERTLLAFTIQTTDEEDTVYDCFIAELKPQNRVFTLNIAGSDFRRLQFLSPEAASSKSISRSQQMSHLLVIIPKVIVCLYKIKMQLTRDGAVMAAQPDKETVLTNFAWYQWDPQTQYLYHARFETATTRAQASVSGKNILQLSCVRFSNDTNQCVFIVTLPLPYNETLYTSSATQYNSPFSLRLPMKEINLKVLYRRDGYWCACLQHCSGTSTDQKSVGSDSSPACKVDYTVYILHNGYQLYGQVPMSVCSNDSLSLHFMLIGAFVVVYIPGFMLHLLNIGPRVDPCHHLTFGPEHALFQPTQPQALMDRYSKGPDNEVNQQSVVLTSATSFSLLGDQIVSVLDSTTGLIYDCSIDPAGFLKLFKESMDPELMEDLLHLVIVGFSDPGMALSMIEHVCHTPMQYYDHKLFAEFVTASSFANVYLETKPFIARQLPLTIAPTFHGKVCKNQDGVKLAYLKLSHTPNFVKQLLVQSDQKLVVATADDLLNHSTSPEQPFDTLCFNALINQSSYRRLDMRSLATTASEQYQSQASPGNVRDKGAKKKASPRLGASQPGIIGKLSMSLSRRQNLTHSFSIHTGKDPHEMLWFLEPDEDLMENVIAEVMLIREQMLAVIGRDLPLKSKNTVYNATTKYYAELQKQSCKLLLAIWTGLGFNMDNHPLSLTVCRVPSPKEQILHELLEAYLLSHLDIGLHPPSGFHTLYSSIAFMCFDSHLFLQHLHNKVVTPTKRFVDVLVEDCEEDESDVAFHIFNSLCYDLSEYALKAWYDPTVKRLRAAGLDRSKRS